MGHCWELLRQSPIYFFFVCLFLVSTSAHTLKQQTKLGNWQGSLQDLNSLGKTRRNKRQEDNDLGFQQIKFKDQGEVWSES